MNKGNSMIGLAIAAASLFAAGLAGAADESGSGVRSSVSAPTPARATASASPR